MASELLEYEDGDDSMDTFLAAPSGENSIPGVGIKRLGEYDVNY